MEEPVKSGRIFCLFAAALISAVFLVWSTQTQPSPPAAGSLRAWVHSLAQLRR